MRRSKILTTGLTAGLTAALAALAVSPAAAQLGVGAATGVNVGAGVGVDTGRTLDTVTSTVDRSVSRAVDTAQRLTDRTMTRSGFVLATSADLRTGAEVRDMRGQRIGTVSRVDGNAAVVVSGQRMYRVPVATLYHRTSGNVRALVTSLPRAQLTAHTQVHANANAAAAAGY